MRGASLARRRSQPVGWRILTDAESGYVRPNEGRHRCKHSLDLNHDSQKLDEKYL